jgi:uncharacterized protein YecT (DUF1311 family)
MMLWKECLSSWWVLLVLSGQAWGQSGLLLRDHPQAGLVNTRAVLTNPESADAEDQACLAKARDMVTVQRCDDADIKRQKARMETAYATLLKLPDVDRNSVFASQAAWKKYFDSTCTLVGYWHRWPAEMGKPRNTCEWRMTRMRADELEILLKDASDELLPQQRIPR